VAYLESNIDASRVGPIRQVAVLFAKCLARGAARRQEYQVRKVVSGVIGTVYLVLVLAHDGRH